MSENERRNLLDEIQHKKPVEPCNLHNATTQLQRYYMAHPIAKDGWKTFRSDVNRMDADRPWRMKPPATI
jgi:hypothetical protein